MGKIVKLAAFLAVVGVCSLSLAQDWSLNWYSDVDWGSATYIHNNLGGDLAEGLPAYLMWAGADGVLNGISAQGFIQGDDQVVIVDGGAYGVATIGEFDQFLDPQVAGEFNYTNTLADTYQGQNLYSIAFDNPVAFQAGIGRFSGVGFFGYSPQMMTPDGSPSQFFDFTGAGQWTTNLMIPEPATLLMLGTGLAGILAFRKRRTAFDS